MQLREPQLREETQLSDPGRCEVRLLWTDRHGLLLGMPEGLPAKVLQSVHGKPEIPQVDGAIVDVSMHGSRKVAVCLAAGLKAEG